MHRCPHDQNRHLKSLTNQTSWDSYKKRRLALRSSQTPLASEIYLHHKYSEDNSSAKRLHTTKESSQVNPHPLPRGCYPHQNLSRPSKTITDLSKPPHWLSVTSYEPIPRQLNYRTVSTRLQSSPATTSPTQNIVSVRNIFIALTHPEKRNPTIFSSHISSAFIYTTKTEVNASTQRRSDRLDLTQRWPLQTHTHTWRQLMATNCYYC